MQNKALIVGASGVVGSATAKVLAEAGWTVTGLARKPGRQQNVTPLAADLLDAASLAAALADVAPTHVFIASWLRQPTEAENIRVNAAMVRNLLDAVRPAKSVRHVALVTGLKHYLGPFEAYGKGTLPQTPFREEQDRLDIENFYYAQEDEVFSAAGRDGFDWSVHRPHTIIGKAVGNAMNMGTTLAVYAAICRETGRPFRFPGVETQWNGLTDMTSATVLARHMLWPPRRRKRLTRPSTSSTATSSAGAGCGSASPAPSASRLRRSTARSNRWRRRWPMTRRSGAGSPSGRTSWSTTSTG